MTEIQQIEQIAAEQFPDSQFTRVRDVCVFAEHQTKDSKGRKQKYDRAALEAIVQKNNDRILDTGNFSPVTKGHTDDDPSTDDPEILGYAGLYRLGKIGNKNPRYAIFCDEWQHKDHAKTLKNRPFRSPEVWMNEDMGERFFHPIASLGAEAPRLDMGMTRFHRRADGQKVERYQAAGMPVMPAAGNTFITTPVKTNEKEDYNAMAPEDIQAVIEAISNLDWVQWVQQQMAQESAAATEEAGPPTEAYDATETEVEVSEGDLPTDNTGMHEDYDCDGDDKKDDYMAEDDSDKEDYAKSKGDVVTVPAAERKAEREKYRAMRSDNESLKTENYQLRQQLESANRVQADNVRQARIEKYALEYGIDSEDELSRCLYSKGSEMTDSQFDAHCEAIERYAMPSPVGAAVPAGKLPQPAASLEKERYSAEWNQKIIDRCTRERENGNTISFAQGEELLLKEMQN